MKLLDRHSTFSVLYRALSEKKVNQTEVNFVDRVFYEREFYLNNPSETPLARFEERISAAEVILGKATQ